MKSKWDMDDKINPHDYTRNDFPIEVIEWKLRQEGIDPDEMATRGKELVEKLLLFNKYPLQNKSIH